MGISGVRLLIQSCETLTLIKPGAILHYYITKKQSAISRYLR